MIWSTTIMVLLIAAMALDEYRRGTISRENRDRAIDPATRKPKHRTEEDRGDKRYTSE